MNTVDLSGKNIFVVAESDHFIQNIIRHSLASHCFTSDSVLVVYFSSGKKIKHFQGDLGQEIDTTSIDKIDLHHISQANTINLLSLQPDNAKITLPLIENYGVKPSQIYIIITDDEVVRWKKCHEENGSLKESKADLISSDVIEILRKKVNIIAPMEPWGNWVKALTGYDSRQFVDASLPFKILEPESENALSKEIKNLATPDRSQRFTKVMLFTKKQKLALTRFFLRGLLAALIRSKHPKIKRIQISIWLKPIKLSLSFLFLLKIIALFAKLRKVKIDYVFLSKMPPSIYYLTLLSQDFLILQQRGGFSSAEAFCQNTGRLLLIENSPNHLSFRDNSKAELAAYETPVKLFSALLQDSVKEADSPEELKGKIEFIRERSNSRLKDIWSKQ